MKPRRTGLGGTARVGTLGSLLCLTLLAIPLIAVAQGTPVRTAYIPVELPRDEGAHDTTVEWWYFTGHLVTADGARYGFEYVIFRGRSGGLEGYAAHFAVSDTPRGRFQYDQRISGARGVAGQTAPLDLDLNGWTMRGGNGHFALAAEMPGYGLRLDVATTKPVALHEGDAYIEYGNGTASYYYSWTRLTASGELEIDGKAVPVTGTAWMDHQWGDFATYQEGGWDWYALQLDDGRDVMLYVIRDASGEPVFLHGSLVAPEGTLTVFGRGDFVVTPTGEWTSGATGTTYPAGWRIEVPAVGLDLAVTPTMPDQELDTRATTGVIYWEGDAVVAGTADGKAVRGNAYVELTGYAPFTPIDFGTPEAVARSLPDSRLMNRGRLVVSRSRGTSHGA